MRFGKKKQPFYRIVVLDKRKKRDGAYIEELGTYNPLTSPATVVVNKERFSYWKGVGALPSASVSKLKID
jgi:small subunit ribosomal protein S16